jgi:hypothetical protein
MAFNPSKSWLLPLIRSISAWVYNGVTYYPNTVVIQGAGVSAVYDKGTNTLTITIA